MFWKSCCFVHFHFETVMPVFGNVFVVDCETRLCFERVVFSLTLRHVCPCLEAFLLLTVGNVCFGRVVVRVYLI